MSKNFNVIILSLMISHFIWGVVSYSLLTKTIDATQELQYQCGSYCFHSLRPIMDLIDANPDTLNKTKQYVSQAQLEKLETKLKEHHDWIIANEKLINQTKATCSALSETPKKERFEKLGSKYYYIEKYHKVSWFAAAHLCRQMGGHLASPQNENELNILKKELVKNRRYWLDITDLIHGDEYLSYTTGKLAPYLQWSSGEPNNRDENCVEFRRFNNDENMNDAKCDSQLYFICEPNINF